MGQIRAFQNALVQSDKIKLRLIKMAQNLTSKYGRWFTTRIDLSLQFFF